MAGSSEPRYMSIIASSRCSRAGWLCALAVCCNLVHAAPRPTVVELYTSEGCSSCPPADALLGELKDRPNVLALGFHVGYWDSLGWADRFALPYSDQRQSRYAQSLRLSTVFTPQMVIDGQRSLVGSDRGSVLRALGDARDGVPIAIGRHGDSLTIDLAAPGTAGDVQQSAEVLLLALVPETQTAIGRGENGGRTLREFNIVRATFLLGRWNGGTQRFTIACAELPADAPVAAVLVQQAGQRSIVGAASYLWR
jgi:hypothetical protein